MGKKVKSIFEFLAPTKSKIIAFIIILLVFSFYLKVYHCTIYLILDPGGERVVKFMEALFNTTRSGYECNYSPFLIYGAIIPYLLAALVVFVLRKYKVLK